MAAMRMRGSFSGCMNDEDFVVVYADSPEEAMFKLRDAGLEPVKAEPFDAHRRPSKGAAPAR